MGYQRHIPAGNPCRHCRRKASQHRIPHTPTGDPCYECRWPAAYHRVKHRASGDPCEKCGLPDANHEPNPRRTAAKRRSERHRDIIGIDGEGQGRSIHKYTLLAASDETGKRQWYIEDCNGLSTLQCLDFLMSLPNNTRLFAYAFNYDLTKILEDLPDETLYMLFRPELRRNEDRRRGPKPVQWKDFRLNLQGTKFTLKRGKKTRIVWDVFKFYQTRFTDALKLWKVGLYDVSHIERLKNQRSDFDKLASIDIRSYCLAECRSLAALVRRLIDAHTAAGLHLNVFYGAGSTSSAILKKIGIGKKRREPPKEIKEAVASAFFGGRFEHSVIGPIEGPIYSYDISSAYPYQLTFLPCLEHGRWEYTDNETAIESARSALVRYRLHRIESENWAPFPFRESDGTISFPRQSGGGWIWSVEYEAARRIYPDSIEFLGAWLLRSDCNCQPFQQIPEYYLERLRIGKEGPGIVIKLGINGSYGKLAQSIGYNPPFQSWVWAAMVTAGCRSQILDMIALHKDKSNLLAIATDGIYTRENLLRPIPRDTGTGHTDKPLGGWEKTVVTKGVFFARPGIYFPLSPTEDEIKNIKGRGVGKRVMLENWRAVIDGYERGDDIIQLPNVSRFCGAKTSISVSNFGKTFNRAPTYGQWVTRNVKLSLSAKPKREAIIGQRLTLREFPLDCESNPYSRAMVSPEALELKLSTLEASEQPEGVDFADYEV